MTDAIRADIAEAGDIFTIYVDYDPSAPDASRVFEAVAALIRAVEHLDRDLAQSVEGNFEAVTRLSGVEASSLKAMVRALLRYVDGETVGRTDDPGVQEYVPRARERILRYVGANETVRNPAELAALSGDLQAIAEEAGVSNRLTYAAPQPKTVLERMQELGAAASALSASDTVEYRSDRV
jgi:ABC-type transporter Mla subunit MlaD